MRRQVALEEKHKAEGEDHARGSVTATSLVALLVPARAGARPAAAGSRCRPLSPCGGPPVTRKRVEGSLVALPAFDVLSVCSGGGGLDLGLQLAEPGARVVGYIEREAFAAAIVVARMEDAALHPAPVSGPTSRPSTAARARPRGLPRCGIPVPALVHRRKAAGTVDSRWLWPEIARVIRQVEPRLVFLENVPGPGSAGARRTSSGPWPNSGSMRSGTCWERTRWAPPTAAGAFSFWPTPTLSGGGLGAGGGGAQGDDRGRAEGPRGAEVRGGDVAAAERAPDRQRAGLADPLRHGRGSQRNQPSPEVPARGVAPAGPPDGLWTPRDLFPPGPSEIERWREVLAVRPELAPATQPCLCRVADGAADRLVESVRPARLHLLGNGVVPLQAARAWTVLMARVLGEVST